MLFSSVNYIFFFLPIVVLVYFLLTRYRLVMAARAWVFLASLYFYAYWNTDYLLILLASILVNYSIGTLIYRSRNEINSNKLKLASAKSYLIVGVIFNLGLLGYFKYADFLIENVNQLVGSDVPQLDLILPLAISFFTFQQIAYLVDCYKTDTREYDFLNYCVFVSFFPQLIAGPIVHHKEMMPQFMSKYNVFIRWQNIAVGVFIFSIGLFKKLYIADTFAIFANQGYATVETLGFYDAWITTLSYTFQLYYDFSAYSDMAIGAALLFNIRLPINFNSPYKSRSIREFWQRWHITLSRWLRDYVYIPLGGNRKGSYRAYSNVLATFLLGGLWHGAGWTFILWGALHGLALVIQRLWTKLGIKLHAALAWFITFMFVHFSWVFFRAENIDDANHMFSAMFDFSSLADPRFTKIGNIITTYWADTNFSYLEIAIHVALFWLVAIVLPNSLQITKYNPERKIAAAFNPRLVYLYAWFAGFVYFYAVVSSIKTVPSKFLYFNF